MLCFESGDMLLYSYTGCYCKRAQIVGCLSNWCDEIGQAIVTQVVSLSPLLSQVMRTESNFVSILAGVDLNIGPFNHFSSISCASNRLASA